MLAIAAALSTLASSAFAQSGTWTSASSGSWTNSANWSGGTVATNTGNTANFSTLTLSSSPTVTLDGARTIGNLTFGDVGNTYGWALNTGSAGPLTLAVSSGSPLITVNNQTTTIGAALAGSAGLGKAGAGTLVLTGANTYTGTSYFTNGTVTYSGSGGSSGAGALALGTGNGNIAVFNMNSSGTVAYGSSAFNFGGTATGSTGAGVFNQTAGTVNFTFSGYNTVGNGGYGAYVLSAGTVNFNNTTGIIIGDNGGNGLYYQTGGTLNLTRIFVLGGATATPTGVATITGGSLYGYNSAGYGFKIPNAAQQTALLTLGPWRVATPLFTSARLLQLMAVLS